MTAAQRKKIEEFKKERSLQNNFRQVVLNLSLEALLWPEKYTDSFPPEFLLKSGSRSLPYPLLDSELKVGYVEEKIRSIVKGEESTHPGLVYYYLTLFEKEYAPRPAAKSRSVASKKKSSAKKGAASKKRALSDKEKKVLEEEKQKAAILRRIQKMKRSLPVSAEVKKIRTEGELLSLLLKDLHFIYRDYGQVRDAMESLESDLNLYRDPGYLHPDQKKSMKELLSENADLKTALRRETLRSDALEAEVSRLAEQIISAPIFQEKSRNEEIETLRREHNLLASKYDALVSKNIELVNRIHKMDTARSLEDILDNVRDRINSVLRSGVEKGEDVLLKNIQGEISQVQRARIYLGRALYDVGLLFLRIGDKRSAVTEFRAARELGIEDPEINRIINSY